jgi:uncharacterized protein (DUF427 family)
MRVMFGGAWIARSDDVVLLHEPGRYPVAYFPKGDIARDILTPTGRTTNHPDLGPTVWYALTAGEREAPRGAWEHTGLPEHAGVLADRVAFAWHAMDAFYEEDERILGHAADAYHRIDIRATSRALVVLAGDTAIAETHRPLVLYESGFAPRWYVPRADVNPELLEPSARETFCPYKGICTYYNIGDANQAAWSYREPYREVDRIADLISFEPDKVTITIDGEELHLEPGQRVVPHGPDRGVDIDEVRQAPGPAVAA